MSSDDKNNNSFKNPHKLSQKLGKLDFTLYFKYPKELPSTCAAMARVAKSASRDDESRRSGNDDYSLSLGLLMLAFDTFVKEYSKGTIMTGSKENYDLSNPCELTIFLIWNIRHIWVHNGGVIDEKCKKDYKKIIANSKGIEPVINLPKDLEIGYEFILKFEDYFSIKKCIFQYIKNRVSKEDYEILSTRSSVTDIQIGKCEISIPLEDGHLIFDLVEAYDHGFSIDPVTKIVESPENTKYDFGKKRIILSDGRSFPARFIPPINTNELFIIVIPNTRIDMKKLYEMSI